MDCHHYNIPDCINSLVRAACVGNVAGVVSLAAPGARGLAARVRDQGGGRAQRPGRVSPLSEDELPAAEELLLHSVHRALDHGVRVVKKGEGGINQVGPGAGHSLLRLDFNYIKLSLTDIHQVCPRKGICYPPPHHSLLKDPFWWTHCIVCLVILVYIKDLINIRQQSDKGLHHESKKSEDCVLK